jgi:four helix bundle protein
MATFKSFEEIEVWQKARALSSRIYNLTLEGTFSRDYKLRDQINASSGSIMDNIAEGFERDGTREFIQFLSIAKGSSGETRSQLYRALDRGHISEEVFDSLLSEILIINRQLSSLMKYLAGSGMKGNKFIQEPDQLYGEDESRE